MAISIPTTLSTNRLSSAEGAVWSAGNTGTLFIRVKPNWNSNDSQDHLLVDFGYQTGTTYRFLRMEKYLDNNVYMGFVDQGTGDFRVTTSASTFFVSGTWSNHLLTWDTAAPGGIATNYYVDGVSRGTAATLSVSDWNVTSTAARETFGNDCQTNTYNFALDGSLAEFGRWNRVLTAAEIAMLQTGQTPRWIPNGLVEYRPFVSFTDSFGSITQGPDVTVNAAGTSFVDHPTIIAPPHSGLLGCGV